MKLFVFWIHPYNPHYVITTQEKADGKENEPDFITSRRLTAKLANTVQSMPILGWRSLAVPIFLQGQYASSGDGNRGILHKNRLPKRQPERGLKERAWSASGGDDAAQRGGGDPAGVAVRAVAACFGLVVAPEDGKRLLIAGQVGGNEHTV